MNDKDLLKWTATQFENLPHIKFQLLDLAHRLYDEFEHAEEVAKEVSENVANDAGEAAGEAFNSR